MRRQIIFTLALMLGASIFESAAHADEQQDVVDRGRYLISIGACNDCHTKDFPERAGKVPESEWLLGVAIGFQGPWGTSYPANLRLVAERLTAEQFIARARSELLPPMPWFNLVVMTDEDLTAIYEFIRSLGPVGEPVPAYVPPGMPTQTPYYVFVPQIDKPEPVARND